MTHSERYPPEVHNRALEQHYRLHAAGVNDAASIAREGFARRPSGRNDFRFAGRAYNARQSQYLSDSGGGEVFGF